MWLAIALLAAGASMTGAIAAVTSSPSTAGAASVCADDGANGCLVTLPCASGTCPTVDVSPNVNLVDGQYLAIKARNFDPTGSMRVAICASNTIVPSGGDPTCLAGLWEENQWSPISTPVLPDATTQNLSSMAYPAFFDPSGEGNTLMPAQDLLGTVGNQPGFNCDNGPDPCALVVTEEPFQGNAVGKGPPVSASNSAVVPLSFLASSSGCPAGAPQLQTDSTYSLAQFMPGCRLVDVWRCQRCGRAQHGDRRGDGDVGLRRRRRCRGLHGRPEVTRPRPPTSRGRRMRSSRWR